MTNTTRIKTIIAAAGLAAAASTAAAQDLGLKAPPQSAPIAILGATIHPIAGEPVENGVIYFTDGIIRGVMTRAEWEDLVARARWAQPVQLINAEGKHVYPGLIAPYTQLGLTEIAAIRPTIDTTETGNVTPEVRAAIAANPDSTLLPVTRANGILTAGTFPTGGLVPGRGSVIRLDGWTMEELTVADDIGLVLRWPNMRPVTAWWMTRSEDEQLRDIRESLEQIKEVFTTAKAYAAAKAADEKAPTDLRWEAMRGVFSDGDEETAAAQKPIFVLAGDEEQINAAAAFASEMGLKIVIVGGRDAARCAAVLKDQNIPVIVSGTHTFPRREDAAYDQPFRVPAELHEAGILFSIANGDDTAHERNLPYSAATAVAHGLPADAAIKAITLDAAAILGVDDRLGSLEKDKAATLIITDGSPLEVTTRIHHAFIDGREIDLTSKHDVLYQKYKERYRQTGDLPRSQE